MRKAYGTAATFLLAKFEMSKNVSFDLGPAVGLTSRVLVITRHFRAGDDSAPAAEINTSLAGALSYPLDFTNCQGVVKLAQVATEPIGFA